MNIRPNAKGQNCSTHRCTTVMFMYNLLQDKIDIFKLYYKSILLIAYKLEYAHTKCIDNYNINIYQ